MARSSLTAEPLPQRATNWTAVTLYKLSGEPCSSTDRWGMFSFTSLSLCGCLTLSHTQLNASFSLHLGAALQRWKGRGSTRQKIRGGDEWEMWSIIRRVFLFSSWALSPPPGHVGCPRIKADVRHCPPFYPTSPPEMLFLKLLLEN